MRKMNLEVDGGGGRSERVKSVRDDAMRSDSRDQAGYARDGFVKLDMGWLGMVYFWQMAC